MKTRGFTLIEILIVMVIISIVATTAALTIHFNRNKQIETLANQITDLISLAENDAMMQGTVIGISFTEQNMQFFLWDEQTHQWQPNTEKIFQPKKFLNDLQVALNINDHDINLEGNPELIISPSGDLPAFTLSLGNKNQAPLYHVIGEESGRVYAK